MDLYMELGPDHVLINDKLEPYLIDIEGTEFFDIEHEHSFLQFRFGDYYRYLKNDTLDPQDVILSIPSSYILNFRRVEIASQRIS